MRKLLILTASPKGLDPIRLAEEVRDIDEGRKRSHYRDDFKIVHQSAVRLRDLRRAVVEEAPQMVHFSGHGEGEAGLYLEDKLGNPTLLTGDQLSGLFGLIAHKARVECVVLNGCYSLVQAQAIMQHVPYVIGMRYSIGDRAAIEFSVGFYDAIWNGESIEFAFKSGKVAASGEKKTGEPVLLISKSAPVYRDDSNGKRQAQPTKKSHLQKTIVLLSANSPKADNLDREREVLKIDKAIMNASLAVIEKDQSLPVFKPPLDKSELEVDDISKILSTVEPYIIDISGAEDGLSTLLLKEDVSTNASADSDALIGEFFKVTSEHTYCVVLNGCYVEKQAREIAKHIEFLIGIKRQISHDITIHFLDELYYQLGMGVPITKAYDAACNRICRRGTDKSNLPILLSKKKEEERRILEKELLKVEKKIEETPGSADLRTEKGDLLEKSGEYEQAASAYEKSLHIYEEDYKVWWKKGKTLLKAGKYEKAQKPYQNALLLNPEYQDEYVISQEYGLTLSLLEKRRHSLALYNKSLWLNPRYRAASYERKKIYKKIYSEGKNRL